MSGGNESRVVVLICPPKLQAKADVSKDGLKKRCSIGILVFFFTFYVTVTRTFSASTHHDHQVQKKGNSRVTFMLNKGRLGDNLLNYITAKHLAFTKNVPFTYPYFALSEYLALSNYEKQETRKIKGKKKSPKDVVFIKQEADYNKIKKSKKFAIYACRFGLPLKNPSQAFLAEIKRMISPLITIPRVSAPEGYVSVAIHVRRGSGGDLQKLEYYYSVLASKFPPDSYYLEQINVLYQYTGKKRLYVYIFTDYKNPQEIALRYQQALNNPDILFDYRKNLTYAGTDVASHQIIEDLFMMTQCDYLIRPHSSLSMTAQIIGNYVMTISPKAYIREHNQVKISQVYTALRGEPLYIETVAPLTRRKKI